LTEQPIEIAVILVAYNSRDDLAGCLAGVDHWAGAGVVLHVVVVNCASTDGSAELVRQRFPGVTLLEPGRNLGFAGGNNLGWEHVQTNYPAVKYVALLNPDTLASAGWLGPLVARLEDHPRIATCQPLITLHDQPGRINTAGNRSHYLGFGFVTRCGEPIPDDSAPKQIGFCSGAAMLIRAEMPARYGLFEPDMFLYCEDTDLGWKLSQLGYTHELIPGSRVAHKFRAGASLKHYYYLERNRLWLLFVYFKRPTLLLVLPALLLMELGQILFALLHGKLGDKLRTYGYFLNRDNRKHILGLRREAQDRRTVRDKDFLRNFTGTIDYPTLRGPLVRYIANPLFGAYWWLARRVIFW